MFVSKNLLQDLYEFVCMQGKQEKPFTLVVAFPHSDIPISSTIVISELELDRGCVLTVVAREDSPDPVDYLRKYTKVILILQRRIIGF